MAERLDTPRVRRGFFARYRSEHSFDETFGKFSESFATFMGTPKFIMYMTAFVIIWIAVNLIGIYGYSFDPYPFILLNLAFSTQASYAAPLILLAQNRQEQRDRVLAENDRQRAERNLADTEFLTREIASLRLAMQDVATRDFVRSELRDLLSDLVEEIKADERGEGPSESH
ncbi:hypothetical protein BSR29_02175 [Boudabousia liubingyangii]|uniref:DUF1003 domain-containing protein n=1 Tax=Boudabousia liubingyangii TaxID=1921764 RepID=A0A1Q5PQG8_9ACTO|nr:DUF1003 domain-containing protein [Boudabousia liubingyangii]OKL48195.1 hypothetical protein BSR28_00310 [Boudabousia liubingyangii]OKL49776.1 hypothetical protein BSR29_02175 [Boudabousia liubingyangii]